MAGAVLGTVTATDADLTTPTFSITAGDPRGWFQINAAGQISLTAAGVASLANDFETAANTRNLTVQATDGTNSSTVTVTLNEQNLNDNAPVFGAGSYTFGYNENQVAGAVLGTVTATDADLTTPTFSITAGDPSGWFQINAAGQISLTAAGVASLANDFETAANTRNLTVRATDAGSSAAGAAMASTRPSTSAGALVPNGRHAGRRTITGRQATARPLTSLTSPATTSAWATVAALAAQGE
ncbi:MAG: cadherin repeat domain-containing protein [Elusimicrobia bacterium]|nr:cadherin repeat domain-containing protein [Elusimicrobiota bacterium]